MEKRNYFGNDISLLGLGTMRLPVVDGQNGCIDKKKAEEMFDYAIEHGINYFDTAYMYHNHTSEDVTGEILSRYDRDSYYLATKMPAWLCKNEQDVEKIFEDQLRKLKTDHFDFYLCHDLNPGYYPLYEKYKVTEFLNRKKAEGYIRHLGFSVHDTPENLKRYMDSFDWEFCQIQLNYIDWDLQDAETQYKLLTDKGLPIIIMEPLRGGALTTLSEDALAHISNTMPGQTAASLGLRYAAQLPNVMTVLSGMSNLEQLKENIETMTSFSPLSDEETKNYTHAMELYKKKNMIPCTGCRYCEGCPHGVDIATLFAANNRYRLGGGAWAYIREYELIKPSATEDNCTNCEKCLDKCPQGLPIPTILAETGKMINEAYRKK